MTRSTALLLPALLPFTATAQSVLIPDEDLQVLLYDHCATCMDTVSGMMDVGLWNAGPPTGLAIPLDSIQDGVLYLTGIGPLVITGLSFEGGGDTPPAVIFPAYPIGLQGLSIDRVDFDQFPDVSTLGEEFISFYCFDCGLSDIPLFTSPMDNIGITVGDLSGGALVLPPTLRHLFIQDCGITFCPVLPPGLLDLTLDYNAISSIDQWSDSLQVINVGSNLLTELPSLPATLLTLNVHSNPLAEMPPLPSGLLELTVVSDTQLTCLPILPEGLTWLQVTWSGITCLPNIPLSLVPNLDYVGIPAVVCDPAVTACQLFDPLVTGTVFNDVDSDGVQDGEDAPRPNAIVRTTPGNILTASGANGRYVLPISTGPYSVNGVPVLYNTITTAPHAVNLTAPAEIDSLNDIGYHAPPGVYDLVVSAITSTAMVPGFAGDVWFTVKNVGTEPTSAEITFTLDPSLTWQTESPAVTSMNGNTGTWSIPEIGVGELLSFTIGASVGEDIASGTPLVCQATAMPSQTDVTPLNNFRALDGIVVSSYDPNDKRVEPTTLTPTEVAAGTPVTYTIRFQNTGTAPAQRVVVKDTLRMGLQRPTFEFLGSSHPCTWYMLRSTLYFIFDDIQLPDSATDEAGSHGYVQFSVIPRTNLALGEQVTNEAFIYFDYNDPILTEQAVLTVDASTAVPETSDTGLQLWPNPVEDVLFFDGAAPGPYEVLDITGRLVRSVRFSGASGAIDVSALTPGSYQLRCAGQRPRNFITR